MIQAYLDANRAAWPHKDLAKFRKDKLKALETCTGIRMCMDGVADSTKPLFMLFRSLAGDYVKATEPSGWLEAGLLWKRLEELDRPELGLCERTRTIDERRSAYTTEIFTQLDGLFRLMWREEDFAIDSQQLLAEAGFDDSMEPKMADYYDEM